MISIGGRHRQDRRLRYAPDLPEGSSRADLMARKPRCIVVFRRVNIFQGGTVPQDVSLGAVSWYRPTRAGAAPHQTSCPLAFLEWERSLVMHVCPLPQGRIRPVRNGTRKLHGPGEMIRALTCLRKSNSGLVRLFECAPTLHGGPPPPLQQRSRCSGYTRAEELAHSGACRAGRPGRKWGTKVRDGQYTTSPWTRLTTGAHVWAVRS